MPKKRSHEEFVNLVKNINDEILVLGHYVNNNTKIEFKHKVCGYTWRAVPSSILRGHSCPSCGNSLKNDFKEIEARIRIMLPNIKILGEYISRKTPLLCKCIIDEYEWYANTNNLLRGHGCPVCNGRAVKIGYNDLLTTVPWIGQFLLSENDGYKYTSNSHKKINFCCPDCGHIRENIIKNVVKQGFSCPICGDGISYPNKFSRNLLQQLCVENLQFEYSPSWAENYHYDNYFEHDGKKYILEMDGAFHYKDNIMSNTTKEDALKIDKIKDSLAINQNIKIIRINSLKSNVDYLKEQILNSDLSAIFDLTIIDWNECDKYACSNYAKEICDFYQNNKLYISNKQICKIFSIDRSTLTKYLSLGRNVGWIIDDIDRRVLYSVNNSNPKSRGILVYDVETNKLLYSFKSLSLCAKTLTYVYNEKCTLNDIKSAINKNGGIYKKYKFEYV